MSTKPSGISSFKLGLDLNRLKISNKNLKVGVKLARNRYETEASGGVSLKNIKKIAETGIDRVSIGEITHSVRALDFKLEI